jgi:YggT family protein
MLYQIADLLLTITVTIVAGSCLMLCYMDFFKIQLTRVHSILGGQIAYFLLTVTDWITQPLRKLIQNTGKVNSVYLVSGYLVVLAKVILLSLLSHRWLHDISQLLLPILLSSLIEYIELFLSIISGITFV